MLAQPAYPCRLMELQAVVLGVARLKRLFAGWEEAGLINRIRSFDGTFVPPDANVNLSEHIGHGSFTERAVWTDSLLSESTLRILRFKGLDVPGGTPYCGPGL